MNEAKIISLTALRKQLGSALGQIRLAVLRTENGHHEPVEFMGYRFTGSRLYKAPGQIGYVWRVDYSGVPCTDWTEARWPTKAYGSVSGTLDDCAAQLHARIREESRAEGESA